MNYNEALNWVKDLDKPNTEVHAAEKIDAIHMVMNADETFQMATKEDLIRCIKWLWNYSFVWMGDEENIPNRKDIEEKFEYWNTHDTGTSFREFAGLTEEEYRLFLLGKTK